MNSEDLTSKDALTKMRQAWRNVAIFKAIICCTSLQLILGSALKTFLLIGFIPPLIAMFAYIVYTKRQAGRDPQLLQILGDSTYYLGFLFTVLSIVAAMVDLGFADISNDETMKYIATRFALAMITTVIGMGFRAYIVTFALNAVSNGIDELSVEDHNPEQNKEKQDDNQKQVVDLVINAISDDKVFQQLQESMNKAIHDFNDLANNAYTVRAALEGSAKTLVERTGESLQKATEEMTKTALDGISETISKANKIILDNLEETTADNQKALIQLRETNLQLSKEAAENISDTAQAYQKSLDSLLSEFTKSLTVLQEQATQASKDNLAMMSQSVEKIAPIMDRTSQTILQSAEASHVTLEKSAHTQMQIMNNLNAKLIESGEVLDQSVKQVSTHYNAFGTTFENLAKSLQQLEHDFNHVTHGVTNANSHFGNEISSLKQHSDDLANFIKMLKLSTESYGQLKAHLDSMQSALAKTSEQFVRLQSDFMDNAQKTSATIEQLSQISENLNNNATKFNGGIDYLNTELGKTSDSLVTTVEKYEKVKQSHASSKPWWKFWK